MTAKALLDRTPNPTDAEIREGMARTLCRCMTYYRIQSAIKRAATTMNTAAAASEHGGDRMTTFTNVPKQVEELLDEWSPTPPAGASSRVRACSSSASAPPR